MAYILYAEILPMHSNWQQINFFCNSRGKKKKTNPALLCKAQKGKQIFKKKVRFLVLKG